MECDLRWGVPKDSNTRTTICTCMEELDRCHEENNGQPFFINMLGARSGSLKKNYRPETCWKQNGFKKHFVNHLPPLGSSFLRCCFPDASQDKSAYLILLFAPDRFGWIPAMSDVPDDVSEKYAWVPDTSITTMEILHGAYRLSDHCQQRRANFCPHSKNGVTT